MEMTSPSRSRPLQDTGPGAVSHAPHVPSGAELEGRLFIWLVRRLLLDGEAHLVGRDDPRAPPLEPSSWGWQDGRPRGVRIGWTDNRVAYLDPRLAYPAARWKALSVGQRLLRPLTLWRRLAAAGLLARSDADRHLVRIRVDGRQPRVVALAAGHLRLVQVQVPVPQPVDPVAADKRAKRWAGCEDGLRQILAVFDARLAKAMTGDEIERGLPCYWRGLRVVRVDAFLGALRMRPVDSWIGVSPDDYHDMCPVHLWSRASIERAHRKAAARLRHGP